MLPRYEEPPQPLLNFLTTHSRPLSRHFFDHVRQYNSMFAMTSMGAKVIDSINDGHRPYVFKISGQVCHIIDSLIPTHGARPEYAQLYLFDTEHEISNRINVVSSSRSPFHANADIVQSLIQMLDSHNPIVRLFQSAHERLLDTSNNHYSIRIFGDVDAHGDVFSFPVASEVVGLVVGDKDIMNVTASSCACNTPCCFHMGKMASTITLHIVKPKHLPLCVEKRQRQSTMLTDYMIGLVISTHP
jgi:hypothetical protein